MNVNSNQKNTGFEYTEANRQKVESLHKNLVDKYCLDLMEALDLHNELQAAIKRGTLNLDGFDLSGVFLFDESLKGFDYWNHIYCRYFFNEPRNSR